ncbi:MAG: DUF1015 domain-containing protein [Myxococcota bacterium]
MSEVRPFRALRYDPGRVDLSRVLVPPFDVISAEDRERLWARDPHCAVRLVLTRRPEQEAATDYGEVAARLADWRRQGVLRRDPRPSLYVLRQRFPAPDGRELERLAFFGALRLEDYERRIVRPHERTLAEPKADRLRLLRAARANLSSVLFLYEDRADGLAELLARACQAPGARTARDEEGVEHPLAPVESPDAVADVQRLLADRPVVIADGHHRYETALAYRDERLAAEPEASPDAPFRWLLGCFANAYAPGNLLLPIHRVVKKGPAPTEAAWRERLPRWSEQQVELAEADGIGSLLDRRLVPLADRHAFAVDDGSGRIRVFSRPREGELDVRVVHREVLDGVFGLDEDAVREGAVGFPKSALQAARDVRAGLGAVALYLNAQSPDDVFRVTAAGELMPQKSTFFYPKLPTGMVFRELETDG